MLLVAFLVLKSVQASCSEQLLKNASDAKFHHQHGEPEHPTSGQWAKILREPKVRKYALQACILKTTASCAILFRDVTAMLMKPVIGHLLRELAKFKIPLVGSR